MLLGVGEQYQLEPQPLRHAHRGELDIRLSFRLAESPPEALREALKERAYEIVGLLNLGQGDFVTPSAPFQLLEVLAGGQTATEMPIAVTTRDRHVLDQQELNVFLARARGFLTGPIYGPKHRVALELYAAHFTESQVRVRFILLVIAMEALAEEAPKHQVALDLLARWKGELDTELAKYDDQSEEFYSLKALSGELSFRRGDSINNQVRKLFAALPGLPDAECKALQRRAVAVYSKRSTLVHDGYLPPSELPGLETEARELLETLFSCYLQSQPEE
ncbi:hypothetical protein MHEL_04400 [Mycolicibacterium helvum]|uniref:Apea-like HEPN domain-containing protein n=2 Tax=Mycolicibacterium helvum TaxID=1534349 RepID=A0A7I7SYV4_9MYCO|nr:hypothetical protein MHEL_04400 [Mycolicibacterium helvum]